MNEEQREQRDARVVDLAAWLTAIWDEDEARLTGPAFCGGPWPTTDQLLGRIAADRQILARYVELVEWRDSLEPAAAGGARIAVEHVETVVGMLALPYADRPGYREEWQS